MEDIISLENALADCEYEIDSLTGSKRHYDDLVGFSTFSVTLDEVQTLTATPEGSGFGRAADAGGKDLARAVWSIRSARSFLGIVMFWPVVLLLAAGGGTAVVITKKRRKKREAEWAAQAAQPLVPPEKKRRNNRKERRHRSKTGAFVLLFCVFRLIEQLLRVDAEQLRQREQIGCARVGRAGIT